MTSKGPNRPVVFVNQHYAPDVASTGQHLTDLAEALAERGDAVGVICGRSAYLSGHLDAPAQEGLRGVQVRRLATTGFGRGSTLGRVVDYLTFFIRAFVALLVYRPRPCLVVFLTTPPMLPALGPVLRRLRGIPYGIWAMDLHPEAEEAAGMLRPGGWVSRFLRAVAGRFYRGADFVVDLGPCMKDRILEYGPDADRLSTIPVWTRADEVFPVARGENPLLAEAGLVDDFVVMYSGNAGIAHTFDALLDAIARLQDHEDMRFLFVGGGPRRAEILDFVEERGIRNVLYRDYYPREYLASSLSMAHLHLLTLRDDMAGVAVPGKLFGIMAVGRPVLVIGPRASEPAMIVKDTGCGWVVDPSRDDDPVGSVVDCLELARRSPREVEDRGQRGLAAFHQRFCASRVLPQWSELVGRTMRA